MSEIYQEKDMEFIFWFREMLEIEFNLLGQGFWSFSQEKILIYKDICREVKRKWNNEDKKNQDKHDYRMIY